MKLPSINSINFHFEPLFCFSFSLICSTLSCFIFIVLPFQFFLVEYSFLPFPFFILFFCKGKNKYSTNLCVCSLVGTLLRVFQELCLRGSQFFTYLGRFLGKVLKESWSLEQIFGHRGKVVLHLHEPWCLLFYMHAIMRCH